MRPPLKVGDYLDDPTLQPGWVCEIVAITSGRMPTPIDISLPPRGSTADACARFGGSAGSKHLIPFSRKGQP